MTPPPCATSSARTELASGTFCNYFRSKEEVYEALADDGDRRFRPALGAPRAHAKNFEDYLRTSLRAYFEFLVVEYRDAGRPPEERRPHVRTDTPEMSAVYQEVRIGFEDAIARGLAPKVDADYLTVGGGGGGVHRHRSRDWVGDVATPAGRCAGRHRIRGADDPSRFGRRAQTGLIKKRPTKEMRCHGCARRLPILLWPAATPR